MKRLTNLSLIVAVGSFFYASAWAKGKKKGASDIVLDPDGNPISILDEAERVPTTEDDDFGAILQRVKQEEKKKVDGPSPDELVEAELQKIKEAEERMAAEEARIEKVEEEKRRRETLEQRKVEEKQSAKWRKEIHEEEEFQEISDSETNWNGLY